MTEPEKESPHRNQATGDAGNSRRILGLSFEALSLIFDGIIAIAAIVGSVFVYRQLISMNGQLAVMREQMKDARAAAKSADVTTDRQLKIAEKQADSQQILADANKDIATAATKSAKATEQLAGSTSDAAAASQKLAAAANDANAVSRQLVETTQQAIATNKGISRAFVFAKGVELVDIYMSSVLGDVMDNKVGDSRNRLIRVQFENAGNTPTQDLTIAGGCWHTRAGRVLEYASDIHAFDVSAIPDKIEGPLFERYATSMVLGPKQVRQFGGCTINALDLIMNELGAGSLCYTFGTIRYRDIFNPNYIHRTEYCFVTALTGSEYRVGTDVRDQKMPPVGIASALCERHNCSDEECDGQSPLP